MGGRRVNIGKFIVLALLTFIMCTQNGPRTRSATILVIRTARCLASAEDVSVIAEIEIATTIEETGAMTAVETETEAIEIVTVMTTRIVDVTARRAEEETGTTTSVKCRRVAVAEDPDRPATVVVAAALRATTATAGEEEVILATEMTHLRIEVTVAAAEEIASIEEEIATTTGTAGEEMIVATETAMIADVAEERTTVTANTIAALPMIADAEAATETAIEKKEKIATNPEEDATIARISPTIRLSIKKRRSIMMMDLRERRMSTITTPICPTTKSRPLKISKLAAMTKAWTKNSRVPRRSKLKRIQNSQRMQQKRKARWRRPSLASRTRRRPTEHEKRLYAL